MKRLYGIQKRVQLFILHTDYDINVATLYHVDVETITKKYLVSSLIVGEPAKYRNIDIVHICNISKF